MSIRFHGGNELIDAVKLLTRAGIKQGDIVAELACGTSGHFVFPAAHLTGPTGRVYAVDILKSVLEAIRSRAKLEGVDNVETVWADLEKPGALKITDGSADLTVLVNDLSQIPARAAVLREAARITKSGGTLLVGDWKQTASPLGPPPERRIAPATARQLAQEAGFEYREEFEAGPYHFGIVFEKK
ncbi:class I SAM-dependent methyltransferase [Candidatus Uhrbacteria bacterium]|nr:class I SAM-dependent methyltransferase [Candidatus Uhrbacteria bacterium]